MPQGVVSLVEPRQGAPSFWGSSLIIRVRCFWSSGEAQTLHSDHSAKVQSTTFTSHSLRRQILLWMRGPSQGVPHSLFDVVMPR
jgi:hypothetical protein